jgi:hypothetical protein
MNTDVVSISLTEIAKRIYNDLQLADTDKYKVVFPPGTGLKFCENDVFGGKNGYGLGDKTTTPQMEPRILDGIPITSDPGKQLWQIKDLTITDKYTEVVVGPSYRSTFDLYGEYLRPVDGVPVQKDVEKWRSNQAIMKPKV